MSDLESPTGPAAQELPPQQFERPGGLLSRVDGHLVMYHDPHCVQAEQYRGCRTNLTALNRHGAPWVVAVTSSRKGEGKSITVANLAAALAELPGTRVCLVDTDSRASQQATIFGLPAGVGMTELLLGEAAYKDIVRSTLIPNLDFIGAGRVPDNPAELLGSEPFSAALEELKRRYSWILLDTPPVHPYTDACVVSALVNGTLLVVRLQETPKELVNQSLDALRTAGGQVLGTFLTGIPSVRDEAEIYGYYGDSDLVMVDQATEEEAGQEASRPRTEKELQALERAWLRQRRRQTRRDEDEESPV